MIPPLRALFSSNVSRFSDCSHHCKASSLKSPSSVNHNQYLPNFIKSTS
jgi:hypothetical protein